MSVLKEKYAVGCILLHYLFTVSYSNYFSLITSNYHCHLLVLFIYLF